MRLSFSIPFSKQGLHYFYPEEENPIVWYSVWLLARRLLPPFVISFRIVMEPTNKTVFAVSWDFTGNLPATQSAARTSFVCGVTPKVSPITTGETRSPSFDESGFEGAVIATHRRDFSSPILKFHGLPFTRGKNNYTTNSTLETSGWYVLKGGI